MPIWTLNDGCRQRAVSASVKGALLASGGLIVLLSASEASAQAVTCQNTQSGTASGAVAVDAAPGLQAVGRPWAMGRTLA
jgi:hypothetical protein